MNTYDQKQYLIKKYIELKLLDKDLVRIDDYWFNPSIYPTDTSSGIPVCAICQQDFDNFKESIHNYDMEVEMKHPKSCLWFDYFLNKIKNILPSVKIIRKKKRKTQS